MPNHKLPKNIYFEDISVFQQIVISRTTITVLKYDDGNDDDISWRGDVCCVALTVSLRLAVAVRDVRLNCPYVTAHQV